MEQVFTQLCRGLRDQEHEVHSLYGGHAEFQNVCNDSRQTSWNASLEKLRTWNSLPLPGSVARILRDLYRLHRVLNTVQPEVVNCHFVVFDVIYFCLLRPLHGYDLVVTTHGRDLLGGISSLQRFIRPYILEAADHVTAVSSALEEKARECTAARIQSSTIHNGIDFDFWNNDGLNKSPASFPVVTNVGALRRVKGQDILMRAFSKLPHKFADARLWLIGDGEDRQKLVRLAYRLGIRQRVTFHGWCSSGKVRTLLQRSTVFACPSRNEGFGLALIEAMAVGLPVVASGVGGIPEILESGKHGISVPPAQPDELADALVKLLGYGEKERARMSKRAEARARDFRWERVVECYESIFQKVS